MHHQRNRRSALKAIAAAPVAFSILASGSARAFAANEKLNIALVGCGGRGKWFVEAIPRIGENIVAMCDVNEERARESFKKLPDVPKFVDYRRMLEKMDKQIDAVIIAAPDHIHAPCGVMAMRMGKHLYCEKPLTNTINEARNSTYTLLPEKQFQDYQLPDRSLPRLGSHEREWLQACRGGPPAMSNFDYGSALTEFVLLGNLATQFDRAIEYDPVAMTCVADEQATAALRRDHRQGWEI